uniref:Reverse transcriptase domain-containing protein n=1 Tax=Tanacetum cinerariifolium TaxID=118510 RepID=A0A6L2M895_TANCI|nr:hypothetical protein [Tanacetum cinerariifolium]
MRARSSSNLPIESHPNPSTSNPKCRNRRRSKQPFILEEYPVDTMADQRTMTELLSAPTEGYAEEIMVSLILAEQFEFKHSIINMMTSDQAWDRYKNLLRTCPHHGFTEFYQLDTFYNALNPADQDSLNSAASGNLVERRTQDVLTIIETKSKVHNSQNKLVVSQVKSSDANSNSSSEIAKLTHAVQSANTCAVTTAMIAILKQFQATPPPASVKAVKEICVTCSGAHPYYQCLAVDGNTFPELWDNIQGYVAAVVINYNQGNSGYRPLGVANQIRPPEKIKRVNEANMKAMKTQINNVKNELRNEMKNSIQASMSTQTNELKNMMASFFQMNIASTSGSGSLPSNTIANPKGELKAITTRSGIVLDGPSVPIPPPFINPEEYECVEETLTDQDLTKDPLHPNIPYPSRMYKQKQQEKNEVQIHKFWQMFKQLHINITLGYALILIPKYQKMLKDLLSNKEKLLELANTPLNENCSSVILMKLLEKLGDPEKFLIPVPLILGRPFLRTARALIDVHREEMILRDGDERLTLNMRHDTSSYSNQPQKESINMINVFNDSKVKYDIFDPEGGNVLPEKLLDLDSTKDLHTPHHVITTSSSSPNHLLKEFADKLVLITFPPGNDDLPFDIKSDLKKIEYLLHHDPIKDMDPILEDSIDQSNLADLNGNLVDTIHEMFTEEHALDYSSPPLYDEYNDDLFEAESDTEYVYDDPFDSKGEKIKESKLLIDELDLPSDFLPSFEYDSFLFEDFSEVDALPLTNNEDKNEKKLSIYHASLILENFDPPLYELPFFKEVPSAETPLLFSSKNERKVFKPGILTSKGVHSSLIPELSHQGYKVFKINQILKSPMEIFLFSHGEDIHILDVPCLHFYPP